MLKPKLWSLIAPLLIEIFQWNLVCRLQLSWSTRPPKRIEIRRLRSEILAPTEMAKLVFVFLLGLLARHVYTTHPTGQTIRPTELKKAHFKGTREVMCPFLNGYDDRFTRSITMGPWKPGYNGKPLFKHCFNRNNNPKTLSTTKHTEVGSRKTFQ